jgi:nitrite reductase/ring-hydroxylating ferredoxin subunit
MADFAPIAKIADVGDGEMASFDVGGTQVAIANVGGQLYAFGNVCTHEQCPLADGDLEGTTVTCPCHGSQFDVTNGSVLNPPATEPVPSFPARVEGDAIEVQLP